MSQVTIRPESDVQNGVTTAPFILWPATTYLLILTPCQYTVQPRFPSGDLPWPISFRMVNICRHELHVIIMVSAWTYPSETHLTAGPTGEEGRQKERQKRKIDPITQKFNRDSAVTEWSKTTCTLLSFISAHCHTNIFFIYIFYLYQHTTTIAQQIYTTHTLLFRLFEIKRNTIRKYGQTILKLNTAFKRTRQISARCNCEVLPL